MYNFVSFNLLSKSAYDNMYNIHELTPIIVILITLVRVAILLEGEGRRISEPSFDCHIWVTKNINTYF